MNYDIFNKIFTSFYECGRGKKPLLNEDKFQNKKKFEKDMRYLLFSDSEMNELEDW